MSIDIRDVLSKNKILILMLLITSVAGSIAQISVWKLVLYLYVQVFVIYLTGKNILQTIHIKYRYRMSEIFVAYAIGYSIMLFLYLGTLVLKEPRISIFVAYLISLLNILRLVKSRQKESIDIENQFVEKIEEIAVSITFLVVALMMFLCFQARLLSPEITGYLSMYCDEQFWLREAVEGTRGIPMADFSVSGVLRYYHYFSGTWCSFLHYLTGIEIFDICFSLSWVGDVFLLVGAVSTLFIEEKHIKIKYLIFAFIGVLFTSPAQKLTLTYYINHLYVTHFGFLPGMAMGIHTYALFLKQVQSKSYNKKGLMVILLLFFITMGLKAPCGCIVLVGIGGRCLLQLLFEKEKNEKLRGFISGVIFLSLFLVTYRILFTYPVNPEIYKGGSATDRISLTNSLFHSGYFLQLYYALISFFESKYLAMVCCYVVYWIMSNFVMSIFILIAIYKCIRYRIKLEFSEISAFFMVMAGYLVYTVMYQSGYSQVYFMFSIFPFGMYFAISVMGKYENITEQQKLRLDLTTIMLALVLVCGTYKTVEYYMPGPMMLGMTNIFKIGNKGNEYPGSTGNDINEKELEALRWLRDNSEEEAIIITNLAIVNSRSFTTTCFSERQAYIEGEAYSAASRELCEYRINLVKGYYSGENQARERLLDEGVDYAIIFNSIDGYSQYEGEIIYMNEAVKIVSL